MIQKIKTLILSLATISLFALPAAIPTTVLAIPDIRENLCEGTTGSVTNTPTDCLTNAAAVNENTFQVTLNTIINIISIIVGVVAVIMIIFGGFKYITSGGTSEKVTGAKNTILYGLIGLIIVALAQVIIKFVLGQTKGVGTSP